MHPKCQIHCLQIVFKLHSIQVPLPVPLTREVGDSLPQAPRVRGAPNSAEIVQIKFGSSITSQSSLFVLLYCWLQVSLLFASRLCRWRKLVINAHLQGYILHDYCRSSLARVPYRRTFLRSESLIEDGNLQVCTGRFMYRSWDYIIITSRKVGLTSERCTATFK